MRTPFLTLVVACGVAMLTVGCSSDDASKNAAPAPSGSIRYGDVRVDKNGIEVNGTEVKNNSVKVGGKEMLQNGAHKGADEAMHDK
jgi:hypothetical protein